MSRHLIQNLSMVTYDNSNASEKAVKELLSMFPRKYGWISTNKGIGQIQYWEVANGAKQTLILNAGESLVCNAKRRTIARLPSKADSIAMKLDSLEDIDTLHEKLIEATQPKTLSEWERLLTPNQRYYIDKIAPSHMRTTCEEYGPFYNSCYGQDDAYMGRCTRCTLIVAAFGSKSREE